MNHQSFLTPSNRLRPLPRRGFVKGLVLAPVLFRGVSAAYAQTSAPASHGPRGKTFQVDSEVKEIRDAETGARVVQLTGDGSDNVHLYFTSESFLQDSERIVFGSNRTGRFQYYLLEIKSRKLTQLTDGASLRPHMGCLARNGLLAYFDGQVLRSLKVDTLEDREVYRVPDGFEPQLPTCNANGSFVVFAYREKRAVSTQTNVIYSSMSETFFQHPSCVIMRINMTSGQPTAVWGERNWISHVLIHPTLQDQILFCHEGGGNVQQRMFMIDATVKLAPKAEPLFPMRKGEFTVHEYFTQEGEVGFQYEVERGGKMEYYNAFIRTDGTWIRQYKLPGPRPGHIQSNSDNTLIVGDRGFLSYEDKTGSFYMSLMTHGNGIAHTRRLCRHQPGPTQHSHGHPVFSPNDKWVIFNSRIGAKENIAMADVTSL
jgi:oligogalacturonide lyase